MKEPPAEGTADPRQPAVHEAKGPAWQQRKDRGRAWGTSAANDRKPTRAGLFCRTGNSLAHVTKMSTGLRAAGTTGSRLSTVVRNREAWDFI